MCMYNVKSLRKGSLVWIVSFLGNWRPPLAHWMLCIVCTWKMLSDESAVKVIQNQIVILKWNNMLIYLPFLELSQCLIVSCGVKKKTWTNTLSTLPVLHGSRKPCKPCSACLPLVKCFYRTVRRPQSPEKLTQVSPEQLLSFWKDGAHSCVWFPENFATLISKASVKASKQTSLKWTW